MATRVKRGDGNYSEVCVGRVEERAQRDQAACPRLRSRWDTGPGLEPPAAWLRGPCPDAGPAPQEKQDKAVLQSEVASLRQNNQRLQEESQAASEQLRKFAEIFCREKKEL